ncbi:hypothetical protein AGABI1DRAFT_104310 [Agaricus bisporus var. burnettii JB137-S8]|uniref:Uncharacterized protein n=1 Tax=Agaricus bisporus var. burnettii (strain JB137-S8 / ATCC MYA-4627 / FGSC 10392) TaxID=597362 RepID=K5Y818_AGABU|nr:uncharacterized protein AGABI1DRAFT_104310 [Agaricus bisporus var. burnettii JB137-S8]EKM84430.1 hypothetical protein AGABI1DRAFT_104310 [Agaricus bisporus var. burnettii JB137-S8]
MPFVENAREFHINGGNFHDLKGNQNNYNYDQSLNVSGQGNSAVYSHGPYYNGANNSINNTTNGNGSITVVGQGAKYQGSPNPAALPNLADQMNNINHGQSPSQSCSPPPAAQPCYPGIDSGQGNSALHLHKPFYNGPNNSIKNTTNGNGSITVVGQGARYQDSPNPTGEDFSESLPKQNIDIMVFRAAMGPNLADQMNNINHGQSPSQPCSPPPAAQPCNPGIDSGQENSALHSRGPYYNGANNSIANKTTGHGSITVVGQGASSQGSPNLNGEDISESVPQWNNDLMVLRAALANQMNIHGQSTQSYSSPPAAHPCNHGKDCRQGNSAVNSSRPLCNSDDLVSPQSEFSESLPKQNNDWMKYCAAIMLSNFLANQMNNFGPSPSESYSPPPAYSHGPSLNIPPPTHSNGIFSHSTGHVNQPHFTPQQQPPPAAHHSPPLPQQPVGPYLSPSRRHSQISVNSAPANVQQVQINQSTTQPHAPQANDLVSSDMISQQLVSPPADHQSRPSINPLPGINVTESSEAGSIMSGTTLTNGPQLTHTTSPSIASAPITTATTESSTSSLGVTLAQTTPSSTPSSGLSENPNLIPKPGVMASPSETTSPVEEVGKRKKKRQKFIASISRLFGKKV